MSVSRNELEEMNEELTEVVSRLNDENKDLLRKASERLGENLRRESRRIEEAIDGLEEAKRSVEIATAGRMGITGITSALVALMVTGGTIWLHQRGLNPLWIMLAGAGLLVLVWGTPAIIQKMQT
jgi:CRISPR/Cas system CMR subunit Cmr6 (Cas7 group RAMP superfamily)